MLINIIHYDDIQTFKPQKNAIKEKQRLKVVFLLLTKKNCVVFKPNSIFATLESGKIKMPRNLLESFLN